MDYRSDLTESRSGRNAIVSAVSVALGRTKPLYLSGEALYACTVTLQRIHGRRPGARSVAVTSALPGEGTSTVAVGLAVAQALSQGRRTVLLDLSVTLTLPWDEARASLDASGPIADVVDSVDWIVPELGVLTASQWAGGEQRLTPELVRDVLGLFRLAGLEVVADLPPLAPHGSAGSFVAAFDAVALVVRAGSTSLDVVTAAAGSLPVSPVVVLNGSRSSVPRLIRRRRHP